MYWQVHVAPCMYEALYIPCVVRFILLKRLGLPGWYNYKVWHRP